MGVQMEPKHRSSDVALGERDYLWMTFVCAPAGGAMALIEWLCVDVFGATVQIVIYNPLWTARKSSINTPRDLIGVIYLDFFDNNEEKLCKSLIVQLL